MAIGETILGSVLASFFEVLFDKLATLILAYKQRKEAPPSGINTNMLIKWEKELEKINAVLAYAEDKQQSSKDLEKQRLDLWLDDVRELAYDMEDLLDEFAIEATEVKSATKSSRSKGWMNWEFSCFGRDKSSGSSQNPRLLMPQTKVQEINGRLEKIVSGKDSLRLIETKVDKFDCTNKRIASTSLLEVQAQFFGRDEEKEDIAKLLTTEAKNGNTLPHVVAIVGMGGVGKTALAQWLYNDTKVSSHFEKRAWVCVSDNFDVVTITKTILRSVTKLSCMDKDFNELQIELKNNLFEKKFLVVLDDVWNEEYEKWTALLTPLRAGTEGSKIILTTRNHTVVSITKASSYHLGGLPLNSCACLLAFHALGTTNFEGHPNLEIIGKEIAKKCKGLPLVAKMLGGALSNEHNPDKWKAISNNRMWNLSKGKKDEVLPILRLSYIHLPFYLKRCFAYCAVFPKDYEIERDELVLLWIAEGFLDGQKEKEDILKEGRECFDELVSKSFFQQSSVEACKFSMHDLLNDLAKSIAGRTCFSSGESQVAGNEDDASLEKARYASFISSSCVTSKFMRAFHKMKAVRSLMLLTIKYDRKVSISNKVLHDLLRKLKYLRVLSLCHFSIVEVPNCVGDLKLLRYLNFSYTYIKRLPDSIDALRNLQALILRGCRMLSTLPPSITKLVSLQFLDLRDTMSLNEMPLGIGNLKNLIILSKFVVGLEKGSRLKELKNLQHLQGELFISELQKVEEVRDAVGAIKGKQGLRTLYLHWSEDFRNLPNATCEEQVLNFLQPYTNLENLTISYFKGAIFPLWLGDPSYSKIVSLCLRDCLNAISLPPLGQLPSLRELSLKGLGAVSMIGPEFYGSKKHFSSLITLKFKEMLAWKDWSPYARGQEEEVSFSCLQHLVVESCPLLVGTLPFQLDHLIKLEIHSCPHLNNSTSKVCLPSLHELYLEDCNKEILKSLVKLTSLTILRIEKFTELVCFDHEFMTCLVKLKELQIRRCDKLTYLWQDENEMLNLTCLQELAIDHCPQFTSFVVGEEEIELPCNLEKMRLYNCMSLEKLPSKMHTLKNLIIWNCPKLMGVTISQDDPNSHNLTSQPESLQISECDSLTSFLFARGRLATLKTLEISNCKRVKLLEEFIVESLNSLDILYCENLVGLPQCLHTLSHLTRLNIRGCPALEIEDFPPLPVTLLSLALWNCLKIKSIANCNIAGCNNLTKLTIWECPALEIEEFPSLPITLSELTLCKCPKIKYLPNQWCQSTSLQGLHIYSCQNIKRFPGGGLPPNLRSLDILECENLEQPVREWGLPLLTSLSSLDIDGRRMGGEGEKVRFPSKDEDEEDAWSLLFPSSLTILNIRNMRQVEGLSRGLRNHLSSLQYLGIFDCPKLRDLPEDGLPPSLHRLWIIRCQILKDRCSEHTGDCWPFIQEIPEILIR
ncbi:hypothetical protein BT93_B0568 [Corymbia citriodora subsp. variegata]|nr:hypothetical protein BT93_B0568 [Corymbia citriodora subsp. variegata]